MSSVVELEVKLLSPSDDEGGHQVVATYTTLFENSQHFTDIKPVICSKLGCKDLDFYIDQRAAVHLPNASSIQGMLEFIALQIARDPDAISDKWRRLEVDKINCGVTLYCMAVRNASRNSSQRSGAIKDVATPSTGFSERQRAEKELSNKVIKQKSSLMASWWPRHPRLLEWLKPGEAGFYARGAYECTGLVWQLMRTENPSTTPADALAAISKTLKSKNTELKKGKLPQASLDTCKDEVDVYYVKFGHLIEGNLEHELMTVPKDSLLGVPAKWSYASIHQTAPSLAPISQKGEGGPQQENDPLDHDLDQSDVCALADVTNATRFKLSEQARNEFAEVGRKRAAMIVEERKASAKAKGTDQEKAKKPKRARDPPAKGKKKQEKKNRKQSPTPEPECDSHETSSGSDSASEGDEASESPPQAKAPRPVRGR